MFFAGHARAHCTLTAPRRGERRASAGGFGMRPTDVNAYPRAYMLPAGGSVRATRFRRARLATAMACSAVLGGC
ncbi:MAG TPA: hypothetical protein VK348_06215, partial [Planctomycetota bacterium]|nr:hypothetical protein [Planctomycetota bacterium]